jgi:hypothetical protein
MGFISYVPKYITDPKNFVDPKVNKEIHKEAHKLYLRDKSGKLMFEYP